MKKLLLILLCLPLLFSCGYEKKKQEELKQKSESSSVGNWENSEIEKCKKAVKPLTKDPRFKIILLDYNKTAEQFCECYCEEIEKKYKSFDEASKKMTDPEEHNKLQKYCFTGTDNFKK